MHNELTNLLPSEREKSLSRDYLLRLVVIAAVLVTILASVSAVLLIPTYVLLNSNTAEKKAHLAEAESNFSSSDDAVLSTRIAALTKNTATLKSLSSVTRVSSTMRAILAIPRPGIALSVLSYSPGAGKAGTVVITGSAGTRDALRGYQLALQNTSFVSSATLPVSAYANDTDISFTITVTLSP